MSLAPYSTILYNIHHCTNGQPFISSLCLPETACRNCQVMYKSAIDDMLQQYESEVLSTTACAFLFSRNTTGSDRFFNNSQRNMTLVRFIRGFKTPRLPLICLRACAYLLSKVITRDLSIGKCKEMNLRES